MAQRWTVKFVDDDSKDSKNLLTEGKHWPEDYEKTAFNAI